MTNLESFTSGQPRTVDFTAIERELAGLWKAASTAPGVTAEPAVTRACHLNLVVLCAAGKETARATTILTQVTRVCPSRVLMAVVDDGRGVDAKLEAFISAHCSYAPDSDRSRQVCCEQITITAPTSAAARLPGAVLPLLLPDLPVVLWCPGDADLASDMVSRLIDAADRIVVDSRRFADAGARFLDLVNLECAMADLAWHWLRPWRELAAGWFDGRMFEEYPARFETIEVQHAGGLGSDAEALLLGCWAASRLQWRPAGAQPAPPAPVREFAFIRPGGGTARLVVRDLPGKEPAGQVHSLTLRTADASFALRRAGDSECVSIAVTLSGVNPVTRVARVVARDEATLLSRCFNTGCRDRIYDEALRMAARLLGPPVSDESHQKERRS